MPVPDAFREAAVATRALIRERRKEGRDTEDFLRLLYMTAAQHDFLHHTPYIEGLGPAFNVAERIPRKVWTGLEYPYSEIGYRHLETLNKTDVKWLVAAWGEPTLHRSAQEFYSDTWQRYLMRTKSDYEAEFEQRWSSVLGETQRTSTGEKKGWFSRVFGRG